MTVLAIWETSSTNELQKANTSAHVERLALCPAHRGRRSDRPAASAAIERFLTTPRWSGYGKISVPFRFNSSIKRLWIPRASLPVKPRCQRGVCGMFSNQSFAMNKTGARFLACQECCSQLNAIGTQSQSGDDPSRVPDPPAAITGTSTMSTI